MHALSSAAHHALDTNEGADPSPLAYTDSTGLPWTLKITIYDAICVRPVSGDAQDKVTVGHQAVGVQCRQTFFHRVVAQYVWSVNYNSKSICALKGSTVTMECTYKYPRGLSVQKAFWTKYWIRGAEPPDLLADPEYRGRVQYLGDKFSYCTLRLSDVREKDQSKYYFRFITRTSGGKYQGEDGVDLSVTDLQVEVPERVIEGDKITLTCKTTCRLTVRPTFTWYRNGHHLSSSTDQLHLQPVSREDAGRYHCAVWSQNLRSPEVTLNVRCKWTKECLRSISPSGEIVEGSSVTLTCSSDANPPVEYNWFKGAALVAKGETYTMNKISSVDSGEYKCRSSNGYIEKQSEALTLSVLYPPKSISVSISPSGEIVEGNSVNLTCSSDANPPVQNYTWFKRTSLVAKGETYTVNNISSVDSGEYKCRSSNEHGEKYSEAVTLNVLYPPRSVSVSISPSGEIGEGSSVNLTCSSDANPPVQNYTWFKEGGSSPVGSGQNYSFTFVSKSSGYYCVAQNKYGSQKSAALPDTLKAERSIILKKKKRTMEEDDYQNVDPNAKDDTYTALDLMSRSCDVYGTLAAPPQGVGKQEGRTTYCCSTNAEVGIVFRRTQIENLPVTAEMIRNHTRRDPTLSQVYVATLNGWTARQKSHFVAPGVLQRQHIDQLRIQMPISKKSSEVFIAPPAVPELSTPEESHTPATECTQLDARAHVNAPLRGHKCTNRARKALFGRAH
ncbi:B-cell receptor CD22-like [Colossoma macropomum]|uniref:B-cell receptor CD22-like n=1 Tax=Colossoma macropomum TaxID=42526 RepID=UPI0018648C57|nr:B-cell receptor CD22-like [Colossoma macropomum]